MRSRLHVAVLAAVMAVATPGLSAAQGRRAQVPPAGTQAPGITPAEVQQLFDAAELLQAQQRLNISDDQFPQFLRRFKTLQDIRRQGLTERMRRVNQLQRLMNAPTFDESAALEQIKELRDMDTRVAAESGRAYDSIDEVLTVKQRVQFRVFEEMMERQKLELVTRARQANRAKQP
jgi:Spy/CpxP family protein refolding chaperone